jgi:peptidoglycan-associated lipoprotein
MAVVWPHLTVKHITRKTAVLPKRDQHLPFIHRVFEAPVKPVRVNELLKINIAFAGVSMRTLTTLARNPAMIALFAGLALAGCAKKQTLNNPGDLGLGGNGAGGNGVATPGSTQDFTVNVGDRIFFDTDSSAIRADAQQTLARQAQWLNQYGNYSITIEGHADERGTREYNIALGSRRAAATRDFLASQGVAAGRIRVISFGKERPVAVCDDISCWSQNRRAVTVLGGGS